MLCCGLPGEIFTAFLMLAAASAALFFFITVAFLFPVFYIVILAQSTEICGGYCKVWWYSAVAMVYIWLEAIVCASMETSYQQITDDDGTYPYGHPLHHIYVITQEPVKKSKILWVCMRSWIFAVWGYAAMTSESVQCPEIRGSWLLFIASIQYFVSLCEFFSMLLFIVCPPVSNIFDHNLFTPRLKHFKEHYNFHFASRRQQYVAVEGERRWPGIHDLEICTSNVTSHENVNI